MRLEDLPDPKVADDQVLVRVRAAGVNPVETYIRSGNYSMPSLPYTPGTDAAGIVADIGKDVTTVAVGDRVYTAGTVTGAYAELTLCRESQVHRLPANASFEQGAAMMLQGMTAHYLTHSTYPLRPGEICLVHAAAGGAGQWIVAAAKIRGAQVIGTVSTDAKAEIARTVGCDHVINYATADFAVEVKRITEGHGVDVVYDSVGAATWDQSLDSLRPRGMMVSFGNASGSVPPVAPLLLNQKGSIYLTRPSLGHYTSKREELEWRASDPP